jgi:hypothetical protein
MALNRDDMARRLRAARVLRGEGFDSNGPGRYPYGPLGEAVQRECGKGLADPAAFEHRRKDSTPAARRALYSALGMPPGWFDEPDLDKVLGISPAWTGAPGALEATERLTEEQAEEGHNPRQEESDTGEDSDASEG